MSAEQHPSVPEPVSILLPVCNEIDVIEEVLEEWVHDVGQHLPAGSEMLLDDASSDGTWGVLQRFAATYPWIRVYHQEQRDGFFNAAMRLYNASSCPLVFFSDTDGQYVPMDFWQSVPFIGNVDIVHSYKKVRRDAVYRVAASWVFTFISRCLFHHPYHDVNCVHGLMRRSAIMQIVPRIRHTPTLLHAEMLLRAYMEGCRIKELPIRHQPRRAGGSKGLPFRTFAVECWRAYRGLWSLRREYFHTMRSRNR